MVMSPERMCFPNPVVMVFDGICIVFLSCNIISCICYYLLLFVRILWSLQQVETDTLEGVEPCLADIEAEVERLAGRVQLHKHPKPAITPIDKFFILYI